MLTEGQKRTKFLEERICNILIINSAVKDGTQTHVPSYVTVLFIL